MNYSQIANSPWMWLACGACVALVIIQSAIFLRKTLKVSKSVGVTQEQVKITVRTAIVAGIGPSLAILVGMVALLVSMGGPISWFRLSYIGSVAYETYAAEVGAQAAGEALGVDMSALAFATGVWVMTLGSLGAPIITALFADKMEVLQNFMAGGKKALLPVIAAGAISGVFSYLTISRIFYFNSQSVAAIAGFVIMLILGLYNKRAQKKWLSHWAFTLSMFLGMAVSILFI